MNFDTFKALTPTQLPTYEAVNKVRQQYYPDMPELKPPEPAPAGRSRGWPGCGDGDGDGSGWPSHGHG